MSLEQEIKDKALSLGFDAVGITDAAPLGPEHSEHFEAWLRSGCAGRMDYLHRDLDKRLHPAGLLEGARSVIVVALNYKPSAIRHPPTEPVGRVALYAQYEDYHHFIKTLLRELVDFLRAKTDRTPRFRICVDSAPLAEKALAVRAGLGFIGKNHLLIHPQLGPQILLGEVVTTVGLGPDQPIDGSCGACDRCLKACPTAALRPDGFLDARRCISYRTQYGPREERNDGTMEYWNDGKTGAQHSTIPVFQHSHPPGNWLFGCDECLLACPFHRSAPACANPQFRRRAETGVLNLREVLKWTPEEFEARFHDSPIGRLGLEMLQRNARRCLKSET